MSGSNLANVGNFNADNGPNVNDWNRDDHNVNLGAARWIVSSEDSLRGFSLSIAWWTLSSRQAFCLFLEVLPEARRIFCLLSPDYLYLILEVSLKGLI